MPIASTCPHCGKELSIAEQGAGHPGPFAACSMPVTSEPTVPVSADSLQVPGKGRRRSVLVDSLAFIGVLVIGILLVLQLPPVQAARAAARRTASQNHLRRLAIAIQNYHDVNWLTYPPAIVKDSSGKPLYSGRVLLLPYISDVDFQKPDAQAQKAFQAFDKSQAWDSPHNKTISQTAVRIFQDPYGSRSLPGQTDYLFVTGQDTIFEAGKFIKSRDVPDRTSHTMALVEVKNSGINWAEPRDLDCSQPITLPPGNHPGGNVIVMGNGAVTFLPADSTTPEDVRKLATRNGRVQ